MTELNTDLLLNKLYVDPILTNNDKPGRYQLTHLFYANELGEPAQIKNSRLHSIECACETWNELISGGWQIVTNKFQ